MPLSTILQLYRGGQFYRRRNQSAHRYVVYMAFFKLKIDNIELLLKNC